VYGKSIENLIPPKFRAHLPTKTSEITDTGTAAYRTLATGELTHQEQQIDRFNRRIKSESFDDIVGEVTFTDTELTEQFGGGVLDVTYKLNVSGTYTIDQGLLVLESSITDLGNGYEIKTTKERQGSEWPALDGQDYDERLDVVLPFEQQVVDAGTGLGDARTSIKPIDAWRQENRTIDITAIGELLDAFVLAYPSKVNVELPDVLKSVDCIMESTSGEGTQTEDGTVSPLGDYSISMSLRASAQSSATIIPDASFVIKQFWGNNIDSTNIQFFLPSPVVGSDVLTKIAAILGVSVTAWPKFSPEMVILKAVGQKLSLQVVATSQGSDSVSGTGSASTTAGGVGVSQEASLTLKTIRISPTIHDNITVGGDTTPDSVTISATANSEAVGLGPAESSSESGTVNGSLTPTSISATSGLVDWATMSGKYLMRVDAEPYRFGYIQFHCIVVDAGDFPS
jgi:hypothetical protein